MRKVAIGAGIAATLVYSWAQISMTPYLEREPNNSLSAAQAIETPVNTNKGFVVWEAMINPVGDRDFYRFQVAQGGTYSIRVDTNLDAILRLYDSNGNLIAENDNDGNPDIPLNRFAPGLTRNLPPGIYTVEVSYWQNWARARYALRVFAGANAPDYDPTEPNDTIAQSLYLGRISGGEFLTNDYRFLTYTTSDVDVYRFDLDSTGQELKVQTVTYVDTVLRVVAPDGQIYENDDSEWDILNPGASEVRIPLAPRGTYYVFVRANPRWGGYYRLYVSAPLPTEIVLQHGGAEFRLRDLRGAPTRTPFNNADWIQNGRDHCYQMGWWYRIQGTHTRELTLSNLTYYGQEHPNRALLAYNEPDGLLIGVQYELQSATDGGSLLFIDLVAVNFQFQPRTLHLFHYADLDVGGATTNDADWNGERIRVATINDQVWLSALTPFARWQVSPYPQVIDLLTNATANDLANGTLPLEGDFTGALQWTLSLAPFEYRTVRVAYALNTVVVPKRSDIDRNGCVDDADLLAVLFDFGRTGLALETDVNGDGAVDDADLLEVLFDFGNGCG
ncbi:MAG: hypothetical protein KatS3mg016_0853 [Fimbriimonadales bacterium]|nr:MAG: hypothetical protein KatS3mg016_0853 [Fimbriimonadales bacterium]